MLLQYTAEIFSLIQIGAHELRSERKSLGIELKSKVIARIVDLECEPCGCAMQRQRNIRGSIYAQMRDGEIVPLWRQMRSKHKAMADRIYLKTEQSMDGCICETLPMTMSVRAQDSTCAR